MARLARGVARGLLRTAGAAEEALGQRGQEHAALVPTVIDRKEQGGPERAYDIFSRLLEERVVCLTGGVDDEVSAVVVAQLLFLESVDPDRHINLYINSRGGSVTAALAIYDTMQYIRPPVRTLCMGTAAFMGSLLLCGGAAGERRALPHARIMVHQPSDGFRGTASDFANHAEEILRTHSMISAIYSRHCAKPVEEVEDLLNKDTFMSPEQACKFGLIDEVISTRDPVAPKA